MFGMVAATGIKILSAVDFKTNRNNLFIVAIGIGMGMLTLIAPNIFDQFPKALKPILDSGILLTTFVTVLLNAFMNHAFETNEASSS
jgi:xanthine/uracil permease